MPPWPLLPLLLQQTRRPPWWCWQVLPPLLLRVPLHPSPPLLLQEPLLLHRCLHPSRLHHRLPLLLLLCWRCRPLRVRPSQHLLAYCCCLVLPSCRQQGAGPRGLVQLLLMMNPTHHQPWGRCLLRVCLHPTRRRQQLQRVLLHCCCPSLLLLLPAARCSHPSSLLQQGQPMSHQSRSCSVGWCLCCKQEGCRVVCLCTCEWVIAEGAMLA